MVLWGLLKSCRKSEKANYMCLLLKQDQLRLSPEYSDKTFGVFRGLSLQVKFSFVS